MRSVVAVQDLRGVEPVRVGGVGHQDRLACGRADHARVGYVLLQDPVDQRGLAGSGRAADDGQQRRVEVAQAGQDVIVELVDHGAGVGGCGAVGGDVGVGDRIAEVTDGAEQSGGIRPVGGSGGVGCIHAHHLGTTLA